MLSILKQGTLTLTLIAFTHGALADAGKAHLSLVMLTAFECSAYAEMGGDEERKEVLDKRGIEAGREFMHALRAKQITPEELNKTAPAAVLMLLGGDSDDFIIGRVYETAMKYAVNQIFERDENGMQLDPTKWTSDKSQITVKAKNKYMASNCELIQ